MLKLKALINTRYGSAWREGRCAAYTSYAENPYRLFTPRWLAFEFGVDKGIAAIIRSFYGR